MYSTDNQFLELKKTAVSKLPEDLIVPDLKSAEIDTKGNVFAFAGKQNGNECFIIKFDENLNFVKRFGREGKGPGEFSTRFTSPENRLSINTNGDVYVIDYNPGRRLVVFDNEGNHKKDIFIDRNYSNIFGKIHGIKIVGNGTFIALQYRGELPTQAIIFNLNPPKIKLQYPFIEKRIYDNYISSYYGENCIIDTDTNHIVFGNSQICKFHVYDKNGDLKLEVEDKDRTIGSFDDKELDYIIDNHFRPKGGYSSLINNILTRLNADKSRFNKIIADIKKSKNVIVDIKISGSSIYVFPVREDITIEKKFPVEIYNLKGKLVKKGYLRKNPCKIWKSYVFFYERDEEDNPLILKYKLLDQF
jgi:hypothetical protein